MQRAEPSIISQQQFWNDWNATAREQDIGQVSVEQAGRVAAWARGLGRNDLDIVDIGCGAGWLCPTLTQFGRVVATDLSDEVLARAAIRHPAVNFVAGDFMSLDLGKERFDLAVSLEVLSHVADQPAFMRKIAGLLRPGGHFIIATQNRPALQRNRIPPPKPGQLRHWGDRHELRSLLAAQFEVVDLCSITPIFDHGWLRIPNSYKLNKLAAALHLDVVNTLIKRVQEKAWLGWTLMALARKPG
jgi:2-polyprenyl-3-methyl-5-hydroxy-6-metoxy-1,4-benzoquinol methylase